MQYKDRLQTNTIDQDFVLLLQQLFSAFVKVERTKTQRATPRMRSDALDQTKPLDQTTFIINKHPLGKKERRKQNWPNTKNIYC